MSTASKDFKIKNGLIVQGSSATVNGNQVLTTASDLNDLSDVDVPTPADGDSLVYSTTTQTWIPVAISGGGGSASDSFKTISVTGQDNIVADSSTDTLTLAAGSNITITTNASTDTITIASTDTDTVTNAFTTISTPSGTSPVADSTSDTLTLVAGSNVSITGDSSTDSITFAATDTNTTYSVSAESTTGGANLRLVGSDATTDDIKIEGSGATTVTRTDASTVTVSSTDTNTTYTAGNGLGLSGTEFAINTSITADLSTSQTLTNKTLGAGTSLSASLSAGTNKITNLATPEASTDAATKAYVDSVEAGLLTRPQVRAATTTNLTANYSNGTLGVGATLTSTTNAAFPLIDGVALTTVNGARGILVKNQTNAAHNGRYNLTTQGDTETPWVLTRCALCDEADEIPGSYIFVTDGTANGQTGWVQHVNDPATFTVGTDAISVFQFSGAGAITAGTGITVEGNQVSLNPATSSTLGGVELFSNTEQSVAANSVSDTASRTYGSQLNSSGQLVVNVPWTDTDTNTTYSISAETVTGGANLRLTDSASTTDDVKIEGIGSVLVTRTDSNTITINGVTDISFNPQIASYVLVLLDKDKMIEMNAAAANTVTIPTDSVAFPVGSQISVMQTGAGQTSILGDSGVTVVGTPGLKLRGQWSAATLVKRASNSWVAIGDLSA